MDYLDYPSVVFGAACGVILFVAVPWVVGKLLDRLANFINDEV